MIIRDLIVGIILIGYVASTMCCYTLCAGMFLDICMAALPGLEEDIKNYADTKQGWKASLLLVSLVPIFNLLMAAILYFRYEEAFDVMMKNLKETDDWERIQARYHDLLEFTKSEDVYDE